MNVVSEGASDVSLLLDLSEEVLVHIVKLARFTLTDVGHLRATCKHLCDFFDRIRDTVVNDSVIGDLSRYRPYGYWDIDLAAKSGHLEVIQLLHEDEAKRGRVTHCSNYAIRFALERGYWDIFVFVVRHRREVFAPLSPSDSDRVYCEVRTAPDVCRVWPFETLSREQLSFLLAEAPSFINLAALDTLQSAIRIGDAWLVRRILEVAVFPEPPKRSLIDLVGVAVECYGASVDGPAILDLVLGVCRTRGYDEQDVAFRLLSAAYAVEGFDMGAVHSRGLVAVEELSDEQKNELAATAARGRHLSELARLRELGAKCTEAFGTRQEIEHCIEDGAIVTDKTLFDCVMRGDYVAAEFVAPRLNTNDAWRFAWIMTRLGRMDVLRWMNERNLLYECWLLSVVNIGALSPYAAQEFSVRLPQFVLSREIVVFAAPLLVSAGLANCGVIANSWIAPTIARGDVNMLRLLCESVDVVDICASEQNRWDLDASVRAAVAGGHVALVEYMLDVNSRRVPVFDSASSRDWSFFHPEFRPFHLSEAFETAVHRGHYDLARLLDRRLPGCRVALESAVRSRRWRLIRWVLDRKPSISSSSKELESAFLAAVRQGRLTLVRWLFQKYPDVLQRIEPAKVCDCLKEVRDMTFWRALLEWNVAFRTEPLGHFINYDTFVVERALNIALVPRPLSLSEWACHWGRRDVLQAAIDFRLPMDGPLYDFVELKMADSNPPLMQWVRDAMDAKKFALI